MKKIIACFVLEKGTYVEVPVDAVIENGKFKEEYTLYFPLITFVMAASL